MDVQISTLSSLPQSSYDVDEGVAYNYNSDDDFMTSTDFDVLPTTNSRQYDNLDGTANTSRLLYHAKHAKSILRNNHILTKGTRLKLWCLQAWSCIRLAGTLTIIGCFLAILLCSIGAVLFIQREWKHGLQPGWCHSISCTQLNSGYEPSCNCSMIFESLGHIPHVGDGGSSSSSSARRRPQPQYDSMRMVSGPIDADDDNSTSVYSHPFTEIFQGRCPPQVSYSCWINPSHRIWAKLPNLWIFVLLTGITSGVIALVAGIIVCGATQQANVLANVNSKTRVAIKSEYLLTTPP